MKCRVTSWFYRSRLEHFLTLTLRNIKFFVLLGQFCQLTMDFNVRFMDGASFLCQRRILKPNRQLTEKDPLQVS